ncbi:sugar O-acetyltransferase [uncultured Bacteroides sp.]|uniref:sugar O-acetyltransferase n=1 Tax=uncultured Bacteroides sp. TaxID=162156 RepID=UPI00262E6180|nr:sugar O-acetyltransferase [uncultured Bacteroides sp.]
MKTELQKCLDGEPFNGGDECLKEMTLNAKRLLKQLNNLDYADVEGKKSVMKQLFGKVGEYVHLDIDFHCEYGKHIFIGDKVEINMNCTFVDNNIIEIGNNVLIASNVQIYTATHSTKLRERVVENWKVGKEMYWTSDFPVKICDGAWIGGGVIILPGVTIGKNSVIGAGSVVTRSIPDNCVAVGNPCKVIKHIDQE